MYSINFHQCPRIIPQGNQASSAFKGFEVCNVAQVWELNVGRESVFPELNSTCSFDLELFVYTDPEKPSGLPMYFAPRNITVN